MFEGANHLIFELAKDLRRNMTEAEIVLWMHLKSGVNGLKFRRQHPVGIYIADFYCHKVKLIIEIDGLIHKKPELKEHDKKREHDLKALGYCMLRFTNKEILTDIENALKKIRTEVENLFQNFIINQK
jgi:cyclase